MAEGKWNELLGNPLPCSSNQLKTLHSSWKIITILFKQSTPTCTHCASTCLFTKKGKEGNKSSKTRSRIIPREKIFSRIVFQSTFSNFLRLLARFGDSISYRSSRKSSEMKGGKFKNLHKGAKRWKDKRSEKGTWQGVEREKGREGEVKKASKLSRAIIPSWRVQRQRERTLPGIKVLQTCGKCSWGRVGRPRSNQTNRGTSVNLPAAKDYSWNSLCHAEFPVPFFFNDKIARYKVGRR